MDSELCDRALLAAYVVSIVIRPKRALLVKNCRDLCLEVSLFAIARRPP